MRGWQQQPFRPQAAHASVLLLLLLRLYTCTLTPVTTPTHAHAHPPLQEKKDKKEKMKEDKIVDDTEKPDFDPTIIELPVFNPVPEKEEKEKKEKVKWEKEEKIVDDTEKKDVRQGCCLWVWMHANRAAPRHRSSSSSSAASSSRCRAVAGHRLLRLAGAKRIVLVFTCWGF